MVFKVECEQSLRCWECTKDCSMKKIFELPEPLFMTALNDSFKANAGMMLASGLPFQEVENQKNLMIVTIVTSRKKYLEEKQKNNLH